MQIASDGLKGRVFEVSLADLQRVSPSLHTSSAVSPCHGHCMDDAPYSKWRISS